MAGREKDARCLLAVNQWNGVCHAMLELHLTRGPLALHEAALHKELSELMTGTPDIGGCLRGASGQGNRDHGEWDQH